MPEFTINFHDPTGEIITEYSFSVWAGSSVQANKLAIATGQLFYAALVDNSIDARANLWGAGGNDAEEALDQISPLREDWGKCGATLEYSHAGRKKTASFSCDAALAKSLTSETDLNYTSADKGAMVATDIIRASR